MDTTLQIALIVIGIAVVASIILFNKWQEGRHRRRADRAFPDHHRDPLLEREPESEFNERSEPLSGGKEADADAAATQDAAPQEEPGTNESSKLPGYRPPTKQRVQPPLPDRLNPRVDCCIRVEAVEPIEVPRLWAAQAEVFDKFPRTLRWYAFDDRDNHWRRINASVTGAHHWFLAALQLVDREGVVSESDFVHYARSLQSLADQFHAVPAGIPSRIEVLSNARALDRFCAEVDVQIAINVVAEQPMSGTRIFALAEAEGLRLESDGTFHARANDNRTLYVLANGESPIFERTTLAALKTRHLSLILDLPRVVDAAAEFDDMMRFAANLGRTFNATVVDDNGRPFGAEAVDAIRARVRSYQAKMSEEGIPPGGSLARRLFGA
jgi:FtsZ-interacting cell division protein ZipA